MKDLYLYKQPLKEVLLFFAFQLGFTLVFWIVLSDSTFMKKSMYAIPFSSLMMALVVKKHLWYINWIKYLVSGVLMLVLSFLLYYIEEKYLLGVLGDLLGAIVSGIWDFFPGILKVIGSVLILLVVLAVSAIFFALFFLGILAGNVVFTTWILPKFDKLLEGKE